MTLLAIPEGHETARREGRPIEVSALAIGGTGVGVDTGCRGATCSAEYAIGTGDIGLVSSRGRSASSVSPGTATTACRHGGNRLRSRGDGGVCSANTVVVDILATSQTHGIIERLSARYRIRRARVPAASATAKPCSGAVGKRSTTTTTPNLNDNSGISGGYCLNASTARVRMKERRERGLRIGKRRTYRVDMTAKGDIAVDRSGSRSARS